MAQLIQDDPFNQGINLSDFPRLDGTGHNVSQPALGGVGTRYRQVTPPDYGDGYSTPAGSDRLGAREISNQIFAQTNPIPNQERLTGLNWLFGQFINHEIDKAKDGTVLFSIPIPDNDPKKNDPLVTTLLINFKRNATDPDTGAPLNAVPAAQINTTSAWIDGGGIYGDNTERANFLRTFQGGKLKTSNVYGDNLLPLSDGKFENLDQANLLPRDRFFIGGDVRANQQAGLTGIQSIWVREHNLVATKLAAAHANWSDEQIYQRARSIVVAEEQAITYNEYLPTLLGSNNLPAYKGYNENVLGQSNLTFAAAAFRIGHSQVTDTFNFIGANGQPAPVLSLFDAVGRPVAADVAPRTANLSLSQAFVAPLFYQRNPNVIDNLLRGASVQLSESVDLKFVDPIRNVFSDLPAENIQRGRDVGLPDYNSVRATLDRLKDTPALAGRAFPPITNFNQITSDSGVAAKLQQLYGDINNIDFYVGLLAEDHLPGSALGPTASEIIKLTFQRLRDGDRFYYKNPLSNGGLFTPDEIALLDRTRFSDIIRRNTDIKELQDNVFTLNAPVKAGNETIVGGLGEDSIDKRNLPGNDLLIGGAANDTLYGGAGNDTLIGGSQNDVLVGGEGNDLFAFQVGYDVDLILDFVPGEDRIGLGSGLTFANISLSQGTNLNPTAIDSLNNILIKVAATGEILTALSAGITNPIAISQLGSRDFISLGSFPTRTFTDPAAFL